MTILSAQNVQKNFGEFHALKGVSLTVQSGECLGLLGPNGAGKSTFINLVYGAALRTGGDLSVFGFDPTRDAARVKERLGVVPQENALDEGLTVVENMRLFARFVGLPRADTDARIETLLAYMSLDHKKNAPIRTLSGGMKRRLAFVRALLSDPELLILDEPTTGLDPAVRHLLWQKVSELKARGKTVLLTTHYMHEAEVLCDRIVILNQGRIVDDGAPRALIAKYAPGFVAMYADAPGLENILRAQEQSTLYRQRDAWCLRGPDLNALVDLQKRHNLQPLQIRPSNLEDVYLQMTGEELDQNE